MRLASIFVLSVCFAPALPAATLSENTVAAALSGWADRHEIVELPDGDHRPVARRYSFLLTDERGRVLEARWDGAHLPVPLGSLMKPFCALAFAAYEPGGYPRFVCDGLKSDCWSVEPHGEVGVEEALAFSCNTYFRQLGETVPPVAMAAMAAQFGLPAPPSEADPAAYWGLSPQWKIAPVQILSAYAELLGRARAAEVAPLIRGLALSARRGTAAAVRARGLAKTGTASCVHEGKDGFTSAPGDGFAWTAFPSESPRFLLLVGVHGVPGRSAADAAALMLGAIGFLE
jgi:hypothetical protein